MFTSKSVRAFAVASFVGIASVLAGCSAESAEQEEGTESAQAPGADEVAGEDKGAITNGRVNNVTAHCLHLRNGNSRGASSYGCMSPCSRMDVRHVDYNTGMAYGFSYQRGQWGWANKDYLTVSACYVSGGEV